MRARTGMMMPCVQGSDLASFLENIILDEKNMNSTC